jgi:cytochrome c biogenesis protein CcmG, thiol:disulfide interchange protein DsbE
MNSNVEPSPVMNLQNPTHTLDGVPRRTRIVRAAAIVILAAFTIWISWCAKTLELRLSASRSTLLRDRTAPDFSLPALDGRTISLRDYRDRKTLIVFFWASWCGPCRLEAPLLSAFYNRTHGSNDHFEIIGINIDEEREAADAFARKTKLPFPVLLDASKAVATAYGVDQIPVLYVIDTHGVVTSVQVGLEPGLDIQLAQLLGIKNYVPQMGGPDVGSGR